MSSADAELRLRGLPTGWYALAFSHELPAGRVLRRRLGGQELAIFRAGSGAIGVLDAYCPHLGAHLAEGGRVVGDNLVCPFHGLAFATDGACASGERLRARCHEVIERHGAILVPHGAPSWRPREIEAESAALPWSRPATRCFRIRTHPQEIIENTVDVGHFTHVHGYRSIEISAPLATDGADLTMSYTVTRERGLFGRFDPNKLRFRLDVTASGVGYSRVEVHGLPAGMRLRTVVMPTLVDDEHCDVRVITQVAFARRIPFLVDAIAEVASREMGRDLAADIRVWEHKRYQDPPRLVPGDGPIGPYRRWARQFHRLPVSVEKVSEAC